MSDFYRSDGGAWYRKGIRVTGPRDDSPAHNMMTYGAGAGYEPECSMCWLGHGHSEAIHAERMAEAARKD